MRRLLLILFCVFLLLSLCSCVGEVDTSLTDKAYDEGYNHGFSVGYEKAESFYDDLSVESYSKGYSAGYSDGLSAGYSDGHNDGYNEGIEAGYQNGIDDASRTIVPSSQTSGSEVLTLVPSSPSSSASSASSDRSVTSEPSQTVKSSVTVYITETGTKYHSSGCSYLKNSKISIDKDDAISRGFSPCSRCKP